MATSITVFPPRLDFNLENPAGNEVIPPVPPLITLEFSATRWAYIKHTPTNISSSIDLKNGTSVNAGTPVVDKWGASDMIGGKLLMVTAKNKDGAVALLDNIIIVSFGATEIGRCYVDATAQKCSWFILPTTANRKDTRMNLEGTNDIAYALTQVDPQLEIHTCLMGQES